MAAAVARYPQVRRWIAFSEPSQRLNFQPQGRSSICSPNQRLPIFIDEFGWNTEHEAIGWLFVV
jgi:hypothetical protein